MCLNPASLLPKTCLLAHRLQVDNLESEYQALMYGGNSITQEGTAFTQPAPASSFASAEFSANFFTSTACFRCGAWLLFIMRMPMWAGWCWQ